MPYHLKYILTVAIAIVGSSFVYQLVYTDYKIEDFATVFFSAIIFASMIFGIIELWKLKK